MKCTNCGYENTGNSSACQVCGSVLPFSQTAQDDGIFQLAKDNIFLTMCILCSVSIGFSLISINFPIIRIAAAVFLWIIFAQSKAGHVDSKYTRFMSGTVFAIYVANWVFWGFSLLCALIRAFLGILFPFIARVIGYEGIQKISGALSSGMEKASSLWSIPLLTKIEQLLNMIYSNIYRFIYEHDAYGYGIPNVVGTVLSLIFWFILIAAIAIGIICNLLGWRSIHRFAQSIYRNSENGQTPIANVQKAQLWLLIYGAFNALGAISNIGKPLTFLASGCLAATLILGGVLIKKYYGEAQSE